MKKQETAKAWAGVLAAVALAVSAVFPAWAAEPIVGAAPGSSQNGAEAVPSGGGESSAGAVVSGGGQTSAGTVVSGGGQTSAGTVVSGEGQSSSGTVVSGEGQSSAGTAVSGEGQSSAGTVVSGGGQSSSGTVAAGGSQSSAGPAASGGGQTSSGTIVAGGKTAAGPGVISSQVSDGTEGFAGKVLNPIVTVAEKYSFSQMEQDIRELKSRYGDRLQVDSIGTSLDGRSLYQLVIGNPNAPKHILIHAGIHGREYMTPLLVMKQLEYGLYFYDTGSYEGQPLSQLFQQVAIHYIPMVNPDGIAISQFGLGGLRSESLKQTVQACYAYDQANGRNVNEFNTYLTYWKANARGVDLNQNFPADWDLVTSAGAPSYATYKGSGALSEPESQALANLASSRDWAATVSYHSMGNLIYWDYSGNRVAEQSKALADSVAEKTGYGLAGGSGHGGFKDWLQIRENPVPSLTIETGSVACPMPVEEFTNVWNSNQQVWAAVARAVE